MKFFILAIVLSVVSGCSTTGKTTTEAHEAPGSLLKQGMSCDYKRIRYIKLDKKLKKGPSARSGRPHFGEGGGCSISKTF